MKELDVYAAVFSKEHEFLEAGRNILMNPPATAEELLARFADFHKGYEHLLHQAEKLTRLADNAQNKLLRMKADLERQNAMVHSQHELLKVAHRQLEEISITDSLTGLRNRRFLESFLQGDVEVIQRVYENGRPVEARNLFFMILDLDLFKQVNDEFGHLAGDAALKQFAELLRRNCRKGDIPIRWGGEEFMVVCRDADRQYGAALAERLRQEIEHYQFDLGGGVHIRLTCSMGFAFYPFFTSAPFLLTWQECVNLADQGLYAAKASGRNAWVGFISSGDKPEGLPRPDERSFLRILRDRGGLETLSSLEDADSLALT